MIFEVHPVAFWLLALMVLGCAVVVVRAPMLFHAGLALVGSLFGVAGLYVALEAYFLAGIQVLVYIGAIAVVLMFAIMLTHHMMHPEKGTMTTQPWIALGVSFLLLVILWATTLNSTWVVNPDAGAAAVREPATLGSPGFETGESISNIRSLGLRFLTPYVLPFELVSVLILVAMIGALVVARKEEGRPARPDEVTNP